MKILLIGAGRMGQRHLRGLAGIDGVIHVVDPKAEALDAARAVAAEAGVRATIAGHPDLEAALAAGRFDAAILTSTAEGRLEQFARIAGHGVPDMLLEKPAEQSRERFRGILDRARHHGTRVRCNLYRRTLPAYVDLAGRSGPFTLTLSTGAMGIGCNGIHWIDFALFLSGDQGGRLLWGEIEELPVLSGRGAHFRDYGGRGVFGFADGSRLVLSAMAGSSAPTATLLTTPTGQWIIDQEANQAAVYRRDPASRKPNYLYGQDYARQVENGVEAVDLPALTAAWMASLTGRGTCPLPTLETAAVAHELLFDLLEMSHDTLFAIT